MTRLLLLAGLFLSPAAACAGPARAPKTIVVELDAPFVLGKGQRAKIKDEDAFIRIAGFINSPCPKGARCVWSGQSVKLELTVAGSTVALGGSAPYVVEVLDSDYATRATLRASRAERPADVP